MSSVHNGQAVPRLRPKEGSFEYRFRQRDHVHVLGAIPLLLDLGVGTITVVALPRRLFRTYGRVAPYLFEVGGTFSLIKPITSVTQKYYKLLMTCVAVPVNGCRSFWLGLITGKGHL